MVSNNIFISPIEFDDWENWKNKINNSNDNEELHNIAETDHEWYIRALAVNKINDESILANIAINNSNSYICRLAVSKVQNDELLKEIVDKSPIYEVWEDALSQIDDEYILMDFAENGRDFHIKWHAIKKIKNENLLVNFVKKRLKHARKDFIDKSKSFDESREYSLCRIAIENIHDESLLKEIVINDYNQAMGIEALKNIHNQEFLIDVALNNYDVHYKLSAIENIINDDVLIDIAKNHPQRFVREKAIGKISNQTIAVDIIANDYEIEVDKLNIQHIDDDLLFDLVKKDNDWLRRTYFVKAIQNTDYLKEIACYDVDGHVCKTAVEKIHDESFLKDLVNRDFSSEAFAWDVIPAALKNIHDESFLKDIVNNTKYSRYALKNITDESFLIQIALNCHDSHCRSEALENIYDESILTQIALTDPQMHVRRKAVSKISNDFALINISIMDPGFQEYDRPYCVIYLVRQDAESRLKELLENPDIETNTEYVDVIQRIRYELNEKSKTSTQNKGIIQIPYNEMKNLNQNKTVLKENDKKRKITKNKKDKKSDSKAEINKLLENYKNDVLVTIVAFNNKNLFKKESIFNIVKEPDNSYDMEAIAVKYDNETIAYVANSVSTVVKGTMSAGRIYDKFNNDGKVEIIFVDNQIIAKLIT